MWFKKKNDKEPLIVNIDGTRKEMYNYTVKEEVYFSGEYVDNKYISVFWGISFSGDDKWKFVFGEELLAYSKRVQERRRTKILGPLEGMGVNCENIKRHMETLYVEVEMWADYIENGEVLGDVLFIIRDNWPEDDTTSFECAEEIASVTREFGEDVACGKKRLCGKEYATVEGKTSDEKLSMSFKYYIIRKESMLCEMCCRAKVGHEYMFDEFEKHLKKYKGTKAPCFR
ncbi:MAG: hypothetical protein IJD97_08280 [Clostridia bacterium]|nr:hypothetical protein [Clostridia bacterium]